MENYLTGDQNASLSKAESYIVDVLHSFSGTVRIFSDLENCIFLLSRFPSASYLKSVKMRQIDYFLYNQKMFYILLVSLEDVCLALINKTYEFGLRDQDAKFQIIYNSPRIRRSTIKKRLSTVHKFLEEHRKFRNITIHQAKTTRSEDMGKLFLESMFMDILPEEEKPQFRLPKIYTKIVFEREFQQCIEAQATMYKLISDLLLVIIERAIVEKRQMIAAKKGREIVALEDYLKRKKKQ